LESGPEELEGHRAQLERIRPVFEEGEGWNQNWKKTLKVVSPGKLIGGKVNPTG